MGHAVNRSTLEVSSAPNRGGWSRVSNPPPEGRDIVSAYKSGKYVKSLRGFLKAVKNRDHFVIEGVYGSNFDQSVNPITKTAMHESSGQAGGYIVPLDYTATLLKTLGENSFIYPRAHVVPMDSLEAYGPKVDVETVQAAGTSPFFGGMTFSWGTEAGSSSLNETEPAFRLGALKAWSLLGYTYVSNQFLQDISDIDKAKRTEDYLLKIIAKAAAWAAEYAFLNGTGTAGLMPLGILKAPGTKFVARKTSSQVNPQDIANMGAAFMPSSWSTGIWLCSPTALAQVVQCSGFTLNRPVWDEGALGNPSVGALLTMPLFVTEKLPALGGTGDLLLIDPAVYVIGERQLVVIDVSEHPLFRNNQSILRVWLRLDGWPMNSKIITLQDGTTTVSPFVALQ